VGVQEELDCKNNWARTQGKSSENRMRILEMEKYLYNKMFL